MSDSKTVERLCQTIAHATRSAKFCVAGCLPSVEPGIEVEGLGALRLPLKRTPAKELVAQCRVAPYGKGTQTLVNKKVRNTLELAPTKFSLSEQWTAAVADAARRAAQQLGLPAEQVEARLYKLLVYEKGGFFLPHRDSEKHDRMVASMVVVLPTLFEGGALVIRHGTAEQTLTFAEAAAGKAPCYAAFYADCEHKVERVTSGVRLCLAYNLVLKAKRGQPATAAKPAGAPEVLGDSIRSWIATKPAEPLVFALEHQYSERGLALELLKGADRKLAELVVLAADEADCVVHLAHVSRHLLQYADDGSFSGGYSRRYWDAPSDIEIGETYEDDLSGTDWIDLEGKKQPWGKIPFEPTAVVASVPIDEWKPASEEFEGYTGNEGNTLDRWYHRSALVVWQRDQHYDVVAKIGPAESVPLFLSMAAKLAKTPKKRLEEARQDCIRFARAIIAGPTRCRDFRETPPQTAFLDQLLALHDRDTIALALANWAARNTTLPLKSLVLDACRAFGWGAFAGELKQLIAARTDVRDGDEIPRRDMEWLCAFCCDKTIDKEKTALADTLCARAVARFCKRHPAGPPYYAPRYGREGSLSAQSLPFLLKALVASGRDEELSQVLQFVEHAADEFTLDDCQVPCLKTLIPWSQKLQGAGHPQLVSWLGRVRQQLESATATRPAPPTDWARPADLGCNCQACAQLKAFLADPATEVGRIQAREDVRCHLTTMIGRHECDVKHALERKGSPYSLVLTKTTGSFDRAVKRYEANCKLLSELPNPEAARSEK